MTAITSAGYSRIDSHAFKSHAIPAPLASPAPEYSRYKVQEPITSAPRKNPEEYTFNEVLQRVQAGEITVRTPAKKGVDPYELKRQEIAAQALKPGTIMSRQPRGPHSQSKAAKLINKVRYAVNSYEWHEFHLKKGCAFGETDKEYWCCFGELHKNKHGEITGIYMWICVKDRYQPCKDRWNKKAISAKNRLAAELIEAVKTGTLKLEMTEKEWRAVDRAFHEEDCQIAYNRSLRNGKAVYNKSDSVARSEISANCSIPTEHTPTAAQCTGDRLGKTIAPMYAPKTISYNAGRREYNKMINGVEYTSHKFVFNQIELLKTAYDRFCKVS